MDTPNKGGTTSGQATPTPRKLESMSQEDLIKNTKRQKILLQKLKAKCDNLEGKLNNQSDYVEVKEQLSEVSAKLEDVNKEVITLRNAEGQVQRTNNALKEEFDCLKLKQETLLISLQCLQEDHGKISKEKDGLALANKSMQSEVETYQQKLVDIQNEKQDLSDQLDDKVQQLVALKVHIKNSGANEQKLQELSSQLQKENKDMKAELSAMKITLDMFKASQKSGGEKSEERIAELSSTIERLKIKLIQFKEDKQQLNEELQQNKETREEEENRCKLMTENAEKLRHDFDSAMKERKEMSEELALKEKQLIDSEEKLLEVQRQIREKCGELQTTCDELTEKKDAIEITLAESQSSKEILDKKLVDFQQENEELKSKISELLAKQQELSLSQSDFSHANEEIHNLKHTVEDLEAEKQTLLKTVEEITDEKNVAVNEKKEQQNLWEEEKAASVVLVENLEDKIEEISKANNCLRQGMDDLKAQNDSASTELKEIQEEVHRKTKSLETLKDFEKLNMQLRDELHENVAKVEELNNECAELKKEVVALSTRENHLLDEVNNLKDDLTSKMESLKKAASENTELQNQLDQKVGEITSLDNEVKSLTSIKNRMQEEVKVLQTSVSSDDDLLDKLNQQRCENDANIEVISNIRSVLETTKSEHIKVMEQQDTELGAKNIKIMELESLNEGLQNKLDDSVKDWDKIKSEFETAKHDLTEKLHNAEIEANELSEVNKEKRELIEQNDILQQGISTLGADLCKMEKVIQNAEVEHSNLKEQNSQLESKVSDLSRKLDVSSAKCEELISNISSLQAEKDAVATSLNNLSSSSESKDGEMEKLSTTLKSLQCELDEKVTDYRRQIDEIVCSRNELQNEVISLRDELTRLNSDHEKLVKSGEDTLTALISEYKERLHISEEKQKEFETLLKKMEMEHKDEMKEQKEKQLLLEQNLTDKQATIGDLQRSTEEVNTYHAVQIQKIKQESDMMCEKLREEVVSLQQNYEARKQQLEQEKDSIRKMEASMEEKKKQLAQSLEDKQKLDEKISDLTLECEKLKNELETLENSRQETLSECGREQNKEMEVLQKSVHEKNQLNTKLKAFAVKAKKELDISKQQTQALQEENAQLQTKLTDLNSKLMGSQAQVVNNAQLLQNECDKLQDEIDHIKSEKSNLQKTLEETLHQMSITHSQKEDLQKKITSLNTEVDKIKKDKSDIEKLLVTSKSTIAGLEKEKDGITKEKISVKQELEASRIQISSLTKKLSESEQRLNTSQTSLEEATKNVKQHDLMSLEMAQYEDTVCGLQAQVSDLEVTLKDSDDKVHDLEEKMEKLQEDRRTIEKLRVEAEERVTKTKESLDASRNEFVLLAEAEQEVRGQLDEASHQLEELQQENEQYKLDLSSKTSEFRVLQEKIVTMQNTNQRTVELLERKLKNFEAEITSLKNEKETLVGDYDNYKVRVHSVLKQQKSKESHPQAKQDDTELLNLRQKSQQLQIKLVQIQNILVSRNNELDLLQGDHDRILCQQKQSSKGALECETRWKSRVKTLQQELMTLRKQHADVTMKLTQQNELITSSVNNEIALLKSEHERAIGLLNDEITKKDGELCNVKKELKAKIEEKTAATASTPKHSSVTSPLPFMRHHSMDPFVDYRSMARESGEGEENPDQNSVISFEQILQTPQIKSITEMSEAASLTSEVQLKQLEMKFAAVMKQLGHSTEVARENESTTLRLTDQNKVLKEEIRRLEKNQERENSVSNMEYLKNVICKFITLPPCDEKIHLVPVIDMMLKLSNEERNTMQTIAQGEESSEDQSSSGWGSYLQRWSGMQ